MSENPSPTSIFLVQDVRLISDLLEGLLFRRREFEVVGSSRSLADAIRFFEDDEIRAEIVLFDVKVAWKEGVSVLRRLREMLPQTRFVAHGIERDQDAVPFTLAGVKSFVRRGADFSDILAALRSPLNLTLGMVDAILEAIRAEQPKLKEDLTARELEVLQESSKDKSKKEIAETLKISEETVRTHMKHIFEKMDVDNQWDALNRGVKLGLIQNPEKEDICLPKL